MTTAFLEELTRPATVIAIILAMVAIATCWVFAWYYYRKSLISGRVAIDVNQLQVIDNTKISRTLKIVAKSKNVTTSKDDEGEITDNIYVASVTIWNIGNDGIKKEDVRKPYFLRLDNDDPRVAKGEVLEITPTFYSRDNADQFLINEENGLISWEHFDPGEGFKVRIIYSAKSMNKIFLDGYAIRAGPVLDQRQEREKVDKFNWAILIAPVCRQ
jgi:hypothetical protein